MRALTIVALFAVTFVAIPRAHAELPHLLARLSAASAAIVPGTRRPTSAAAVPSTAQTRAQKANLNLVTTAAPEPPPSRGLVAMTRVEGLALHTLRPTLPVRTRTLRSVSVGPSWPLGAAMTMTYGATGRP